MQDSHIDGRGPQDKVTRAFERPILFYTSNSRTFRTSLIGYLYQLCQCYDVVLLKEELDEETERLLKNSDLFPRLRGQVFIGQFSSNNSGWLARFIHLKSFVKSLVKEYAPAVVFVPGTDVFESLVRRHAKEMCKAVCIDAVGVLPVNKLKEVPLLLVLHCAETRFFRFIPRFIRVKLSCLRRVIAQHIYYVVIPLLARSKPFFGYNGVFRLDYSRLAGIDYSVVFTAKTKEMMLDGGADKNKVTVIPHPMIPGGADPVWDKYGIEIHAWNQDESCRRKTITCFMDIETNWGFRREDNAPISDREIMKSRLSVFRLIHETLPDWTIQVKPHPMSAHSPIYQKAKDSIEAISLKKIKWISPETPADRLIMESGAVVGFPPATTALFSAIMLRPGIPAMTVDLCGELRGDGYLGIDGVITVSDLQRLTDLLECLKFGKWPAFEFKHAASEHQTLASLLRSCL